MKILSLIILAIIIIALFVCKKYNQRKLKIKEAEERLKIKETEERISSLMNKVDDFKSIMKKAKDNASDAINASEAKFIAESTLRDISIVSSSLDKVDKALQEFKGKSLHTNDVDEKIINLETQINDISKKVDAANRSAGKAMNIKTAQMSRVPYTIQNIPFLTSKFIVDYSQRLYVKYSISASTDHKFPIIRAPRKGCEIKLPVVGRKNNRGASEQSFCNKIVECGLQSKFYDNLSLFCAGLNYPYEPDLAYIDVKKSIFLDVEIDEPYVGWDRTPIHYMTNEGTIDDIRNEHFTERGWCIIRFSESQIHNEPLSCLKKIFELLHQMDATISIPSILLKEPDVKQDAWWSKSSAEAMGKRNEREKYLNISSFNPPVPKDIQPIKDYEQGHLVEAKIIKDKDQKCWDKCIRNNDLSTYKIQFPKGIHANEIPQKEDDILWNECDRIKDYLTYIRKSKLKTYLALAQEKLRQKEKEENKGKKDKERGLEPERQAITTTSTPTRTPSSRGYA
ncbi:MAG: hypothetical protein Q4F85_00555 [Prevotella sp.]|nr:hypothetical protein [Prevotella sp.]